MYAYERESKTQAWLREAGEGLLKSKEKGLVTLHQLMHCATEITRPSKSSSNAQIKDKKKRIDNKREADKHTTQIKGTKKQPFPKSFTKSVICGPKLSLR